MKQFSCYFLRRYLSRCWRRWTLTSSCVWWSRTTWSYSSRFCWSSYTLTAACPTPWRPAPSRSWPADPPHQPPPPSTSRKPSWRKSSSQSVCLFWVFVCLGLTSLLNIWGHITTVPACSSGALINVLPHRNAMPQTRDTTPHRSQYTDTGPTCCCAIHWCGTSH